MRQIISAEDIRVDGEMKRLYWGFAIIGIPLFILSSSFIVLPWLTFGIISTAIWIRLQQAKMIGQMMKISNSQFPDINQLADEAANRLTMKRPDIFIAQTPVLNAYAIGFFGKKSIVLHSALIEALEPEELQSVIGHELTHIKCNHTNLSALTSAAGQTAYKFGIPILNQILGFIFLPWSRYAEYTCDRGGLLACRSLNAAISAEIKLVVGAELAKKVDINEYIKAGEDLDKDKFAKFSENWETHPYSLNRVRMLLNFYHSPEYNKLSGDPLLT